MYPELNDDQACGVGLVILYLIEQGYDQAATDVENHFGVVA